MRTLLLLGGLAAVAGGIYMWSRKAAAAPGTATTPPEALPAPPVPQEVDSEEPVDINNYGRYGRF